MKKIVYIVAIINMGLLFIFSCAKNNTDEPSPILHNTRGILSNELEQIGFLHNCELQNVYNELKSSNNISYAEGVNIISKNIISKNNTVEYYTALNIIKKANTIQKSRASILSVRDSVVVNLITEQILDTLTQIISVSNTQYEVETKIMNYYSYMTSKQLSEENKKALTNMCAICAASYDYWSCNKDNWVNLNIEKQSKERESLSIKIPKNIRQKTKREVVEFILADVSGAAFGGPAAFICSGLVAWSW